MHWILIVLYLFFLLEGDDHAHNSFLEPNMIDPKNNIGQKLHRPGVEENTIFRKLPKYDHDHVTDNVENTCDIDLDALMNLENILINKSPYVKAAINSIRTVLETHPALLDKDVGIEEDLAK